MDVVTAMVISTVIAIIFELIRLRNFRDVLASFKLFFEGMGKILVSVVSLIVCGEFFAAGLIKSGFMGTLITAANDAGFGLATMVILGFGRASSPITGAIVAISGLAGVSPFQVAKRTFIPMLFGTAITYIAYFLFWY